jgi:hypothetical protein
MKPMEVVEGLAGFAGRGAGTDAERRAAGWLTAQLSAGERDVAVETFWCRPNWALAHALHAGLAVLGSLVMLASAVAGTAILAVVLASVIADSLTGISLGRRPTPEHASQNVVAASTSGDHRQARRVHLILTANYDAGRTGLVYRECLRRPPAMIRQTLRGFAPGWLGWLSIAIAWLLAIAVLRLTGQTTHAVAAAQLPPTVGLLVALALLLDVALSAWSPAAGDNATGVGVATAVAEALHTTPPQRLDVDVVLTGASDGDQSGLRRYLAGRARERKAANTIVLGIAACTAGRLYWWHSDGPLIPLRYGRSLRQVAQNLAADEQHLHPARHRGRGTTPALPARIAGIPAMTVGCLGHDGLATRSHRPTDTADRLDPAGLDQALQFTLLVVDAIDAAVGELQGRRAATPA